MHNYPDGPHAVEARGIFEAAQARLDKLAESEAWEAAEFVKCRDTKSKNPDEIESACQGLVAYAGNFPKGDHAREANDTVAKRQATIAKLRVDAEHRQQQAEEAASRRQEQEEAAERRRHAQAEATARTQEAQEARAEHEREKRQCVGECRMGCSSARRFDACFQGCVEAKCQ